MTSVKLICFQCGTADVVPADAMLASVGSGELDAHLGGIVSWICGICHTITTAELAWQPFIALVTAGVLLLEEDEDPELPDDLSPHPEHPISGRTFTHDDLLELHELLATDNWFSELTAV
jgi:hypothetical protein